MCLMPDGVTWSPRFFASPGKVVKKNYSHPEWGKEPYLLTMSGGSYKVKKNNNIFRNKKPFSPWGLSGHHGIIRVG